nr:truncated ORF8 protein [Severe acute respiratory syndrome coronavirus 2]QQX21446.1 truncated ORF8 protein [Severe acute respiratory syndrome coronavirus 2]
MKFLVFF